eukprot:766680-Hanusia_phi.AAC.1
MLPAQLPAEEGRGPAGEGGGREFLERQGRREQAGLNELIPVPLVDSNQTHLPLLGDARCRGPDDEEGGVGGGIKGEGPAVAVPLAVAEAEGGEQGLHELRARGGREHLVDENRAAASLRRAVKMRAGPSLQEQANKKTAG